MEIIIVIIIIIFILFFLWKNKEHLTTSSNEAILNIAKVYGDATGTATFNNVNVTGTSSLIPQGTVVAWSGDATKIPATWALCNGQPGTPDLRGRFIVGAGTTPADTTNTNKNLGEKAYDISYEFKLNETGGENKHKLTTNEIPSHSHGHRHYGCEGGNCPMADGGYEYNKSYASLGNSQNTGGDEPHNNIPPYWALVYIIKL
jgi:microcystin-dependent protein